MSHTASSFSASFIGISKYVAYRDYVSGGFHVDILESVEKFWTLFVDTLIRWSNCVGENFILYAKCYREIQVWCRIFKYIEAWITYRITGNFRGGKILVVFVVEHWTTNIYPWMKRPWLPLPAVQAATTKILTTNWLRIIILTPENYLLQGNTISNRLIRYSCVIILIDPIRRGIK